MIFKVLPRGGKAPANATNTVFLEIDHWNDYSFVTQFYMVFHDESGSRHEIGPVKIGFKGQTTNVSTHETIGESFFSLDERYFSLGGSGDYYESIAKLPPHTKASIYKGLQDLVANPDRIKEIDNEKVFSTSLLRGISLATVRGQFHRLMVGMNPLTDYRFKFVRPESPELGELALSFSVEVDSTPSTNIHALIGRNGIGKTTILNGMISAITNREQSSGKFKENPPFSFGGDSDIPADYFSSLVSVSFSAFDPFPPPQEQPDPAKGTCYFYIGLKDRANTAIHRTIPDLRKDCTRALITCFNDQKKMLRWIKSIVMLGSDEKFQSMNLGILTQLYTETKQKIKDSETVDSNTFFSAYSLAVEPVLAAMSSGHAIVLLTITRLVATVEEKTLVLIDEPESHLHPPLLSAFLRALAELLLEMNGVSIIATHSPVVLQEIPSTCVWIVDRYGMKVTTSRPSIETFGENVGVLTSEVFNLEVKKSGFHTLLKKSVASGKSFDAIYVEYGARLGFEARAILASLIAERDREGQS
ncbi:phage Hau3 resistance protein [Herbaspirillum rubrisubalbicans M1]|nr:phage Hau3 resistance protein [Herbaspirillum rubrisubalbicans M1]